MVAAAPAEAAGLCGCGRWGALLASTLPLLVGATALTGYPSPAACILILLLQVSWRLSYWPITLLIGDPVYSTLVRTLLLPPIEITALLVIINRLRAHPKVLHPPPPRPTHPADSYLTLPSNP